eukprot:CAMPEP_0195033812 /NCGR_PEP_ID=MMETSP0326_2-20130528/66451_1 /TAXON_ID=2866 ORGANISM="Crypthecodinium cohnii, Strain Seligo" /NCGR_SAMPLE_ID=MMETSP0326_2 /ASSEMBLY_ACC=CAM_ASM_000348 /LENGTH=152 /DNA_ID=CAMNT_0040058399 /DNA_START=104 /DNA_END=562 /DNA_ORIENTATION=+
MRIQLVAALFPPSPDCSENPLRDNDEVVGVVVIVLVLTLVLHSSESEAYPDRRPPPPPSATAFAAGSWEPVPALFSETFAFTITLPRRRSWAVGAAFALLASSFRRCSIAWWSFSSRSSALNRFLSDSKSAKAALSSASCCRFLSLSAVSIA